VNHPWHDHGRNPLLCPADDGGRGNSFVTSLSSGPYDEPCEMTDGCIDAMRNRLRTSSSGTSKAAMSDCKARSFWSFSMEEVEEFAVCCMKAGRAGIGSLRSSNGSKE